jgi:peptidyl-tRNA hydrolase
VPSKAQYQYILVRGDLPPGLQAAQACHAAFDFATVYPEITRKWKRQSNYICILQVPDERTLLDYAALARSEDVKFVLFHDPDVPLDGDDESGVGSHTALAIEPGEFYRHLSSLPLALREVAMM